MGVDLFFVLSGFLVGYHLIHSWPSGNYFNYIKHYWLKRLLRTFPLYYAIIIIVLLDIVPFYQPYPINVSQSIRVHFIFMQDYFREDLLIPLWSLEKSHFWLTVITLFGFILFSFVTRSIQINDFGTSNYAHYFWLFRAPFHFAFQGMLMGLIVAFLYSKNWQAAINSKYIFRFSSILFITLLLSSEWMANDADWQATSIVLLLINVLFCCMLYACINTPSNPKNMLERSFLRLFSRLSYSLYLTHYLLINIWNLPQF